MRKIVAELNDFDNVYYEICNEPYFGGVTPEWQHHIAEVIADAESRLPEQAPHRRRTSPTARPKVTRPDPLGLDLQLPLRQPARHRGDELRPATGHRRQRDRLQRHGRLLLSHARAGSSSSPAAALYNNLDYSFTVGHEDGTFQYPATQPGGGRRRAATAAGVLKQFLEGFDFIRLEPNQSVLQGGLREGQWARVLVEPGYIGDHASAARGSPSNSIC